MPVKPDPPTRALGRAIADTVARRALFVELHSRDADRLLDHIKQVEAQRDALADALRAIAIMDIRPHPTGDFEAEALAEAQRISRDALAQLEEGQDA